MLSDPSPNDHPSDVELELEPTMSDTMSDDRRWQLERRDREPMTTPSARSAEASGQSIYSVVSRPPSTPRAGRSSGVWWWTGGRGARRCTSWTTRWAITSVGCPMPPSGVSAPARRWPRRSWRPQSASRSPRARRPRQRAHAGRHAARLRRGHLADRRGRPRRRPPDDGSVRPARGAAAGGRLERLRGLKQRWADWPGAALEGGPTDAELGLDPMPDRDGGPA